MEYLVRDQPTNAIPVYSKAYKRHIRTERKQNKVEFNPYELYSQNQQAHQQKVNRKKNYEAKIQRKMDEKLKEARGQRRSGKNQAYQEGMRILKELKEKQRMTAYEIKQQLEQLKKE